MNLKNSVLILSTILACYSLLNAKVATQGTKKAAVQVPTKTAKPKPAPSKPKNYKEITTEAQYKALAKKTKPQIIKFSAEWCGACKQMEPVYNAIAGTDSYKADFSYINTDNEDPKVQALIKELKIESVPTTVFLKKGKETKRASGSLSKLELENEIKSFVETTN